MTIIHGSHVKTPDGEGHTFEYHGNGVWRVMMLNDKRYTGTYDHPFSEKSVTVCKNYHEEEIEKI